MAFRETATELALTPGFSGVRTPAPADQSLLATRRKPSETLNLNQINFCNLFYLFFNFKYYLVASSFAASEKKSTPAPRGKSTANIPQSPQPLFSSFLSLLNFLKSRQIANTAA